MILTVLATLHLIMVHAPGGEDIYVNIEEISSIREPSDSNAGGLISDNVHCMVGMTNGKFISTREPCKEVILKLAVYNQYPEVDK